MTTIDKLSELAKNSGVVVGATTVALGAGFLTGYYFAKNRLEKSIYAEAESEIAKQVGAARQYVEVRASDDQFESPEAAIEALLPEAVEALRTYTEASDDEVEGYLAKDVESTNDMVIDDTPADAALIVQRARYDQTVKIPTTEISPERRNNVWTDDAQVHVVDFDYAQEEAARTEDAPFIISQEEYFENDREHNQWVLTYFAGDDVLLDEDDDPVMDPENWIGEGLLRFGHRSNDNRLVYIRNPVLAFDFQIALSDGKYSEEVLGFTDAGV